MGNQRTNTNALELPGSPVLQQLEGPAAGRAFELSQPQMSIGRTDDNEIVVQSSAISRRHAIIERQSDGNFIIRDNESKNGILVNGSAVREAILHSGDIVQVGDSVFRFSEGGETESEEKEKSADRRFPFLPKGIRLGSKRPIIYGVVALVLGYVLYTSMKTPSEEPKTIEVTKEGTGTTTTPPNMVDASVPQKVVGLEDPALTKAEQDMEKLDWNNSALHESEVYFRRGQREYLNHNYQRAIEAFQTALSLYRGHELATKYLRLAIYEAEAEAKRNLEIGIQYFQSLQYARSIYNFTEVINLMAHKPTDPIVLESEKYIMLARRRMQAAEVLP